MTLRDEGRSYDEEIETFRAVSDVDMILVEGAHGVSYPKVAVNRTGIAWNRATPFPLLATVGFRTHDVPVWRDLAESVESITEWMELRKRLGGTLGVILAGGRGSRLGGVNKAMLSVEGETLASRANALLRTYVSRSVITSSRLDEIRWTGIPVVPDMPGVGGPAGGMLSGLHHADDGVLLLGVDQVAATPATLRRVVMMGLQCGAAYAVDDGSPVPTIAYVARTFLPQIENAVRLGGRGLRYLLDEVGAVPVATPRSETRDIDLPEDREMFGAA